MCFLKNSLHPFTFDFVHGQNFPSFSTPYLEKIGDRAKAFRSRNYWLSWTFKTVRQIVVAYLDILTDVLVVTTILGTVGFSSLWYFPSKLTSVIIFSMVASILLPLWLSCFLQAREEIEIEKPQTNKSKMMIYGQNFLLMNIVSSP